LAPAFTDFRLHFGPIASGDEDVVDATRRAEIYERTQALVVAWEGAGGARACRFSDVPYLEIRGVSDQAGPTAPRDFLANLPMVMAHVMRVVVNVAELNKKDAAGFSRSGTADKHR
jgi:adenosylhomocysteine nucleosidase